MPHFLSDNYPTMLRNLVHKYKPKNCKYKLSELALESFTLALYMILLVILSHTGYLFNYVHKDEIMLPYVLHSLKEL